MDDKKIIVAKPKSLSAKDKWRCAKAGYLVIELPNPSDISFRRFSENIDYVHTNCYACGDRIYMTHERVEALKNSKRTFYCSQGHNQAFP